MVEAAYLLDEVLQPVALDMPIAQQHHHVFAEDLPVQNILNKSHLKPKAMRKVIHASARSQAYAPARCAVRHSASEISL